MKIKTSPDKRLDISCSLCGKHIHKAVLSIIDSPAQLGTSAVPKSREKFLSFDLAVCPNCKLIQTSAQPDPEIYTTIHSQALGGTWSDHHNKLIDFIEVNLSTMPKSALEIGPSVQPILRRLNYDISTTVYIDYIDTEPFALRENETYIQGLYPTEDVGGGFDLIVASHVLEHATNISDFIKMVKQNISESGIAVFSIPNFYAWLDNKYWNAITSEHVVYPLENQITYLADLYGLKVKLKQFRQHSIFFVLSSGDNSHNVDSEPFLPEKIITDWAKSLSNFVYKVETAIDKLGPKDVFITGASHLAQYPYLMSKKIRDTVLYCLDNSTEKHNKRLYGTRLMVKKFEVIEKFSCPLVIVPPSPYVKEMEKQIISLSPYARILT